MKKLITIIGCVLVFLSITAVMIFVFFNASEPKETIIEVKQDTIVVDTIKKDSISK